MECIHPQPFDFSHSHSSPLGYKIPGGVPCGKCVPCIINKRSGWALRLQKENLYHDSSIFVTLTYNDKYVPLTPEGLYKPSVRDIQLFLKRLRKFLSPLPLRYFIVSEYGDYGDRVHYHGILFGLPYVYEQTSEILANSWVSAGRCDVESLGFVQCSPLSDSLIKYATKYIYPFPSTYPAGCSNESLVVFSRRPGIGYQWINDPKVKESFRNSPRSYLYSNGHRVPLPLYYRNKLFDSEMKECLYLDSQALRAKKDKLLLADSNSILNNQGRYSRYSNFKLKPKFSKL